MIEVIQITAAFVSGACFGAGTVMALVEICIFRKHPSLPSVGCLMLAILTAIIGLLAS